MRLGQKVATLAMASGASGQILTDPIPEPEAKYDSEVLTVIDKDRTQTNTKGYGLTLKNSSFRRKENEKLYLEFGLTIEGPPQKVNQVYMMWFQILDPVETERLKENYYESLQCALLYTDDITSKGVHIQNSVYHAFRGVKSFVGAEGRFDKLLADNRSSTFPWFINYRRSSATTSEKTGTTTCNIYRDFETTWSEIQIKMGRELTIDFGYFVYDSQKDLTTDIKGYEKGYKLVVLDHASYGV